MRLTKEQEEMVDELTEDIFENEYDSKEFIKACVREHYEREIKRNS